MTRLCRMFVTCLFLTALTVACQSADTPAPADLLLENGYVYTVDNAHSVAEAVAIRGNKIVFVGTTANAQAYIGNATEVRDVHGAMVMPGLHDMHIHAIGIVEPEMCDLRSQSLSLDALVPILRKCIVDYDIAPGDWLVVLQWAFSSGNQPSESLPNMRAALDAVSTDRPIFVWGNDGHHGAANSAALAMARNAAGDVVGLDAQTLRTDFADFAPMIAVDRSGEPTGGINEDARMLIRPSLMDDMLGLGQLSAQTMPQVAKKLASRGITSIQDALVTPKVLAAYGDLEQHGLMTFRLRAALAEPPGEAIGDIDAHLARLEKLRDRYRDSPLIEANAVKLFADGVLEGNPLTNPPTLPVAAMLHDFKQPIFRGNPDDGTFHIAGYVDMNRDICRKVQANPAAYSAPARVDAFADEYGYFPRQCIPQHGVLEHKEAFIRAYIDKATEAGFHVHVHTLADRAVHVVVDEFAKMKPLADRLGVTQSIAHVQLASPEDQKRIGDLGLYVAFTFVWATPDVQYEMMVAPFIDEVKNAEDLYNMDHYYMKNVYPARSIQRYGGILVNGSDAPVSSRDPMPFASLQQAITRSDGEHVMNADERIDVQSAIDAFTINGAKLFQHDDRLGSIETGKIADLIVLDRNIVELANSGRPQQIADTKVTLTVFDGNVIYE